LEQGPPAGGGKRKRVWKDAGAMALSSWLEDRGPDLKEYSNPQYWILLGQQE
jgi:hypothetical protein